MVFMGRLEKRVAIITGCGRGFGRVIAKRFAYEGAAVSICDIIPRSKLEEKVGSEIEALDGEVLCSQTDVSNISQVNAMVNSTIERFGSVDILVNNVGIAGPTKDCWEISLEEWNRTLAVNLGGTFLCSKAVLPVMIKKKSGRIINIGSGAGKNPKPYRTPYATSKMGLIGFTRSLAVEVGRYNITVNTICPGVPGGERNVEVERALAQYQGKDFDTDEFRRQIRDWRKQGVLGGRYLSEEGLVAALISHEDVSNMALFLASDEASRITGQDINVTAGSTMW